ncbi:hypothetical protein AYI70_g10160, partial [Smittium culicis]
MSSNKDFEAENLPESSLYDPISNNSNIPHDPDLLISPNSSPITPQLSFHHNSNIQKVPENFLTLIPSSKFKAIDFYINDDYLSDSDSDPDDTPWYELGRIKEIDKAENLSQNFIDSHPSPQSLESNAPFNLNINPLQLQISSLKNFHSISFTKKQQDSLIYSIYRSNQNLSSKSHHEFSLDLLSNQNSIVPNSFSQPSDWWFWSPQIAKHNKILPFLIDWISTRNSTLQDKYQLLQNTYKDLYLKWSSHISNLEKRKDSLLREYYNKSIPENQRRRSGNNRASPIIHSSFAFSKSSTDPKAPSKDDKIAHSKDLNLIELWETELEDVRYSSKQKPGWNNKGSDNFTSDAVRSDAELLEIIQKLQYDEVRNPESRSQRTAANIPDMILDPNERLAFKLKVSNRVISNPIEYYSTKPDSSIKPSVPKIHKANWANDGNIVLSGGLMNNNSDTNHIWTNDECSTFVREYLRYPKKFGQISESLSFKSYNDCVLFYYRNKKPLDLKSLLARHKRKNRRGRKTTSPTLTIENMKRKKDRARDRSVTKYNKSSIINKPTISPDHTQSNKILKPPSKDPTPNQKPIINNITSSLAITDPSTDKNITAIKSRNSDQKITSPPKNNSPAPIHTSTLNSITSNNQSDTKFISTDTSSDFKNTDKNTFQDTISHSPTSNASTKITEISKSAPEKGNSLLKSIVEANKHQKFLQKHNKSSSFAKKVDNALKVAKIKGITSKKLFSPTNANTNKNKSLVVSKNLPHDSSLFLKSASSKSILDPSLNFYSLNKNDIKNNRLDVAQSNKDLTRKISNDINQTAESISSHTSNNENTSLENNMILSGSVKPLTSSTTPSSQSKKNASFERRNSVTFELSSGNSDTEPNTEFLDYEDVSNSDFRAEDVSSSENEDLNEDSCDKYVYFGPIQPYNQYTLALPALFVSNALPLGDKLSIARGLNIAPTSSKNNLQSIIDPIKDSGNEEDVKLGAVVWRHSERVKVLDGFKRFGRTFSEICRLIKTKSEAQCRYFYYHYRIPDGPMLSEIIEGGVTPASSSISSSKISSNLDIDTSSINPFVEPISKPLLSLPLKSANLSTQSNPKKLSLPQNPKINLLPQTEPKPDPCLKTSNLVLPEKTYNPKLLALNKQPTKLPDTSHKRVRSLESYSISSNAHQSILSPKKLRKDSINLQDSSPIVFNKAVKFKTNPTPYSLEDIDEKPLNERVPSFGKPNHYELLKKSSFDNSIDPSSSLLLSAINPEKNSNDKEPALNDATLPIEPTYSSESDSDSALMDRLLESNIVSALNESSSSPNLGSPPNEVKKNIGAPEPSSVHDNSILSKPSFSPVALPTADSAPNTISAPVSEHKFIPAPDIGPIPSSNPTLSFTSMPTSLPISLSGPQPATDPALTPASAPIYSHNTISSSTSANFQINNHIPAQAPILTENLILSDLKPDTNKPILSAPKPDANFTSSDVTNESSTRIFDPLSSVSLIQPISLNPETLDSSSQIAAPLAQNLNVSPETINTSNPINSNYKNNYDGAILPKYQPSSEIQPSSTPAASNIDDLSSKPLQTSIDDKAFRKPSYSSYWSVQERNSFLNHLAAIGTNWTEMANAIGTKTATQARNYFRTHREKLGFDIIVKEFEERKAAGLPLLIPTPNSSKKIKTTENLPEKRGRKKKGHLNTKPSGAILIKPNADSSNTALPKDDSNAANIHNNPNYGISNAIAYDQSNQQSFSEAHNTPSGDILPQNIPTTVPSLVVSGGHAFVYNQHQHQRPRSSLSSNRSSISYDQKFNPNVAKYESVSNTPPLNTMYNNISTGSIPENQPLAMESSRASVQSMNLDQVAQLAVSRLHSTQSSFSKSNTTNSSIRAIDQSRVGPSTYSQPIDNLMPYHRRISETYSNHSGSPHVSNSNTYFSNNKRQRTLSYSSTGQYMPHEGPNSPNHSNAYNSDYGRELSEPPSSQPTPPPLESLSSILRSSADPEYYHKNDEYATHSLDRRSVTNIRSLLNQSEPSASYISNVRNTPYNYEYNQSSLNEQPPYSYNNSKATGNFIDTPTTDNKYRSRSPNSSYGRSTRYPEYARKHNQHTTSSNNSIKSGTINNDANSGYDYQNPHRPHRISSAANSRIFNGLDSLVEAATLDSQFNETPNFNRSSSVMPSEYNRSPMVKNDYSDTSAFQKPEPNSNYGTNSEKTNANTDLNNSNHAPQESSGQMPPSLNTKYNDRLHNTPHSPNHYHQTNNSYNYPQHTQHPLADHLNTSVPPNSNQTYPTDNGLVSMMPNENKPSSMYNELDKFQQPPVANPNISFPKQKLDTLNLKTNQKSKSTSISTKPLNKNSSTSSHSLKKPPTPSVKTTPVSKLSSKPSKKPIKFIHNQPVSISASQKQSSKKLSINKLNPSTSFPTQNLIQPRVQNKEPLTPAESHHRNSISSIASNSNNMYSSNTNTHNANNNPNNENQVNISQVHPNSGYRDLSYQNNGYMYQQNNDAIQNIPYNNHASYHYLQNPNNQGMPRRDSDSRNENQLERNNRNDIAVSNNHNSLSGGVDNSSNSNNKFQPPNNAYPNYGQPHTDQSYNNINPNNKYMYNNPNLSYNDNSNVNKVLPSSTIKNDPVNPIPLAPSLSSKPIPVVPNIATNNNSGHHYDRAPEHIYNSGNFSKILPENQKTGMINNNPSNYNTQTNQYQYQYQQDNSIGTKLPIQPNVYPIANNNDQETHPINQYPQGSSGNHQFAQPHTSTGVAPRSRLNSFADTGQQRINEPGPVNFSSSGPNLISPKFSNTLPSQALPIASNNNNSLNQNPSNKPHSESVARPIQPIQPHPGIA